MSTAIIVVGANGRMGRTISGLAAADPAYTLAGLVDSREHLERAARWQIRWRLCCRGFRAR